MIKIYQIKDQEAIYPNCSFTYGMGLSNSFDPIKVKDLYVHVANIATSDFNKAFEIGNIGPEGDINRIDSMHSISVGDILVSETEQVIVAPSGFDKVEVI